MLEPSLPLLEELCHSKPPFVFATAIDAPSYNRRAFCWNQGPPALEPRITGVGTARFAATADEKSYKQRLEMLEANNATSKRVVCKGARRRRCAAGSTAAGHD